MGANQFLDAEGLNAYDKALKAQLQSPESAGVEVYNPEEYTLLADSKKMSNTLFFITPDASVEYVPPLLEDASWSLISRLSEKGTFGKYYKVGDTKTFTLNGNYGGVDWTGKTATAYVAGIDHNQEIESPGEHRVHWIWVINEPYSFRGGTAGFRLTSSRYAPIPIWPNTELCFEYIKQSESPSNTPLGQILPSDLQSVMKPVIKYYSTRDPNNINFTSLPWSASQISSSQVYQTLPSVKEWCTTYDSDSGIAARINKYVSEKEVRYPLFNTSLFSRSLSTTYIPLSRSIYYGRVSDSGNYYGYNTYFKISNSNIFTFDVRATYESVWYATELLPMFFT